MAKKKIEPKVIETIRRKDISMATKRKAMKEVRLLANDKSTSFKDDESIIACFTWSKSPSGYEFWCDIHNAKDKC